VCNATTPIAQSTGGTPQTEENALIGPNTTGSGDYTVHVVYVSVSGTSDQYQGSASVVTGSLPPPAAGTVLISELRTFGPGGAGDDFVEVYNNSNSPVTVTTSDGTSGWALVKKGATCTATPVVIGVIPVGTPIPARGHFLFVGSQYSLTAYASGNQTMLSDIEENANVGLFSTSLDTNITSGTRLDSVGFGTNTGSNCDLLREGTTLPVVNSGAAGLAQHSFYRDLCAFVQGTGCTTPGLPKDTDTNSADFLFVDTNATNAAGVAQQRLGAPGPENLASPLNRNATFGVFLLDGTKASTATPNRTRDQGNTGPNKTFGTLSLRRRFVNNTGAAITRLRFRVIATTTFPRPNGATADVRALSSTSVTVSGISDAATCMASTGSATTPCTVTVQGTTLEEPPNQSVGGGYNATLAAGTVTLGTPLANNASISLQFLLGVEQTGNFRFLMNIEALP
jgi:hypothetical protein